jgi:CheY-like chemotaxis protein
MKDLKVLFVDDNLMNQRLMAHSLLRKFDITVDLASNGKIALEMLESEIYDFVLMDLRMPVMNGKETIRAIRSFGGSYFSNLPICICYSMIEESEIKELTEIGMTSFLYSKPFDFDGLHIELLKCLK